MQIVGSAGDVKDRADSRGLRPEISRQACSVGTATRLMFWRAASSTTSSMIGNEPWAPVPIIKRCPPQGISSLAESGVCPNLSRYGFEGFLLRLRTAPRSMTMSCS